MAVFVWAAFSIEMLFALVNMFYFIKIGWIPNFLVSVTCLVVSMAFMCVGITL